MREHMTAEKRKVDGGVSTSPALSHFDLLGVNNCPGVISIILVVFAPLNHCAVCRVL